jgi:hypothetical protein
LGECTGKLNIIVRQDKEQQEFRNILANTRIGSPTDENVAALMSLHLNSNEFSIQDVQNIEKKAMYVFANKKKMKEFNTERLKEQHSKQNPIARLKVQSTSKNVKSTKFRNASKMTIIFNQLQTYVVKPKSKYVVKTLNQTGVCSMEQSVL